MFINILLVKRTKRTKCDRKIRLKTWNFYRHLKDFSNDYRASDLVQNNIHNITQNITKYHEIERNIHNIYSELSWKCSLSCISNIPLRLHSSICRIKKKYFL